MSMSGVAPSVGARVFLSCRSKASFRPKRLINTLAWAIEGCVYTTDRPGTGADGLVRWPGRFPGPAVAFACGMAISQFADPFRVGAAGLDQFIVRARFGDDAAV